MGLALKYKLSELTDIKHGYAFKGEFFIEQKDGETNNILLTPGNISIGGGFNKKRLRYYSDLGPIPNGYILKYDDIIVNMTDLSKAGDTLGFPAKVPKSSTQIFLHNQRLGKVVNLKPNILDTNYLYYLFQTSEYRHHVLSTASGTTVRHTSPTKILDFVINLPEINDQITIANILSSFDDKIEINNAIIANLEEQAQAIFKSWFVDFEPFLDEGFVDSEVGLIPKGFSVVRLKEVSTRRNGYSYKSKELNELSDTNMITLKNFNRNGGIDFSDTKPIDETERMKEFHFLNSGDILIACTDLTQNAEVLGRTISYFENEEFDKEVYSMDLVKIEPNNIEDQMYIYYYLNSFVFKSFAEGVATGTTVLHLPKKSIDEFKMVYPSSKLVNEFSNLVKPMLLKQNKLTLENKKLEEVRDALLPKLMSGEIRLGEAVESK